MIVTSLGINLDTQNIKVIKRYLVMIYRGEKTSSASFVVREDRVADPDLAHPPVLIPGLEVVTIDDNVGPEVDLRHVRSNVHRKSSPEILERWLGGEHVWSDIRKGRNTRHGEGAWVCLEIFPPRLPCTDLMGRVLDHKQISS